MEKKEVALVVLVVGECVCVRERERESFASLRGRTFMSFASLYLSHERARERDCERQTHTYTP